jgi:hypothetical protein
VERKTRKVDLLASPLVLAAKIREQDMPGHGIEVTANGGFAPEPAAAGENAFESLTDEIGKVRFLRDLVAKKPRYFGKSPTNEALCRLLVSISPRLEQTRVLVHLRKNLALSRLDTDRSGLGRHSKGLGD